MNSKTWGKLQKRCAQRLQEYPDQASKLSKLERKGKIFWDRKSGVVYNKSKDGLPFTGDHDMFAYTDPSGKRVSPWVREQISRDMMNAPHPHCPGKGIIEHPDHMSWDLNKVPDSVSPGASRSPRQVASEIKQRIIDGHAPGGEPLTTFNPDGVPSSSWYEEVVHPLRGLM